MKRRRLLMFPLLILCMATLCVGIYAVVPLSVTITGPLTITPATISNISVNLSMIATGQSGDDIVLSEKTVNSARRFSVADLLFSDISTIEKGEGDEVIVTFTITNNATATTNQEKSDNAIGIFFSENANVGNRTALASDILVSDADSTTTASISSYTAILPQETVKMEITLNLDNINSITETDVPYYLYVEEYASEATTDGLVKLPIINSDSTLFTKISSTTLSSMGLETTQIQYVAIPSSVTKIDDSSFEDCTSLKGIIIPSSVTSIGEFAFLNCSSLEHVTIPSSITKIEDLTFQGCASLKNVTIPSSVTSIGEAAFSSCTNLEEITIPSSVTSIVGFFCNGCTNLTKIIVEAHSSSGNFGCFLPEFTGSAWYIEGNTWSEYQLKYSTTTITYIRK